MSNIQLIKSIVIRNVNAYHNADYIFDTLYSSGIATVSRITMIKYFVWNKEMKTSFIYCHAYAEIHEWHDTERAYSLIDALKKGKFAGVSYGEEKGNIWALGINYDTQLTRRAENIDKTTVFYLVDENDEFYEQPYMTSSTNMMAISEMGTPITDEANDYVKIAIA